MIEYYIFSNGKSNRITLSKEPGWDSEWKPYGNILTFNRLPIKLTLSRFDFSLLETFLYEIGMLISRISRGEKIDLIHIENGLPTEDGYGIYDLPEAAVEGIRKSVIHDLKLWRVSEYWRSIKKLPDYQEFLDGCVYSVFKYRSYENIGLSRSEALSLPYKELDDKIRSSKIFPSTDEDFNLILEFAEYYYNYHMEHRKYMNRKNMLTPDSEEYEEKWLDTFKKCIADMRIREKTI